HIIRTERDSRNLSVAERERIVEHPYEEQGRPGPRWQQLYTPSWEARPSTEPEEEAPSEGNGKVEEYRPPREEPLAAAPPPPAVAVANPAVTEPRSAVAPAPAVSDRYVLLATLWDTGRPPASLASSNGLLALAVPVDASLAELFKKGDSYRFQQGGY